MSTINRSRISCSRWLTTMTLGVLVFGSTITSAQQQGPPGGNSGGSRRGNPPPPPPKYGTPLQGITGTELTAWQNGLDNFQEEESIAAGLGPVYNNVSCAKCHNVPAVGGGSNILVTRFGRVSGSTFDPLASLDGSLHHDFAINPIGLETIPKIANITAHRQSTPLFGLGLIEAIPDSTILAGVRTSPVDGVLGRAAIVTDVASGKKLVGRFGWKAQQATLLSMSGDAYRNEMGITSRLFPTESAPNGNTALLKKLDTVPDPEDNPDSTGKADIDRFADFMRFTAPPPGQRQTASTTFGAKLFLDVGCASCHTPMMMTGKSSVAALDSKPVFLYSDLLLHDMGSLADGIGQAAAQTHEMKTPPLWGVSVSGPYLHDGRAATIEDAIKAHDGEAKNTIHRYLKLSPEQQKLMTEFLNSI